MKKTTLYRKLIHDPEILVTPGVYDGFTARLAQSMGFKSATVSGAGVSESRMCVPDMGIMGLADSVDQFRNIARCVDIPLKADADTGYGNAGQERCATGRICASTSKSTPRSWGSRASRSWKTVSSRKRS